MGRRDTTHDAHHRRVDRPAISRQASTLLGNPEQPIVYCHALASPAIAADVDLIKGRLSVEGQFAQQVLGATNNTGRTIKWLEAGCGFFRGKSLIASDTGHAQNVSPGQTAYFNVTSLDAEARIRPTVAS
jgi:hypothetical protein